MCLAHLDGADQENGVSQLISRVQEVSLGYPSGRLELHLLGGFMDSRDYSEHLVIHILREFLIISIFNPRFEIKFIKISTYRILFSNII